MYIFGFEMYIRCVFLEATLCIVIWYGSTVYLIGNHDWFHLEYGYACLSETIVIFADGTIQTLVPSSLTSYIGEDFVMYFGHQILSWPHTLGGIFYNPNFLHMWIPGIWPFSLQIFPSHHWKYLTKKPVFGYVRALHHYYQCTYACCTTTSHVHMLDAPL